MVQALKVALNGRTGLKFTPIFNDIASANFKSDAFW